MGITTIEVDKKTRGKLIHYKYSLECRSYNDVLECLLGLVKHYKLEAELKEVAKKRE